jgi:hypothetical protein
MSTRKTKTTKARTKPAAVKLAPPADPAQLLAPPTSVGAAQPDGFELSEMEAKALDEADRQAKETYAQYTRAAVVVCDAIVDAVSARAAHRETSNRVRDTLTAAVTSRGLPTDSGGWRYTPGTRTVDRIKPNG